MKTTRVIELKTLAEVEKFCKGLLKLKQSAPVSLSFMLAITANHNSTIRAVKGKKTKLREKSFVIRKKRKPPTNTKIIRKIERPKIRRGLPRSSYRRTARPSP